MESSQLSLLAQAKQGDAKAIATLLNQKLHPKGLAAKTSIKNSCLHIMLEAAKTPPQQPLVDFIRKGLADVSTDDWHTVKVYGRRASEEIPDWVEEFKVERESNQDHTTLARQGEVKAIATLINQKLQPNHIVARVSVKNGCLQVMLEAAEVPNQAQMVALLQFEFQQLEVQGINSLRVYGKQSGDEFPDWQEEINLLVERIEPQKAQLASLELSLHSEETIPVETVSTVQKADGVELSNQLHTALQATCYQHLAHKVGAEDDKTIHEIVEDFVDGLEGDLKRDLDQFVKQVVNIAEPFGFQLEQSKIQALIADVTDSNFAGVRLAIRDLERVTREVLQTDFPQETDTLKSFFSGASQELTAQMFGTTTMGKEAIIGATIGMVAGPLGSLVGGAIGGWLAGSKQQKALEALIEKYQKVRVKLFQEWETLLQSIYAKLIDFFSKTASVKLLDYQAIDQAIEFYDQGNEHLEENLEKAIELYDKAIQLNPGLALAWNNKGFALNQLERFEEALPALVQALQIDRTLVIALNNFGDTLQGLGRNEEAIAAYEESIKLDPGNYSAWWGIGACLYNLQEFEKVIEIAGKLIDLDAENFLGWYAKASCQSRLGYIQQALENLKESVRLNPDVSQQLAKANSDFDSLRKNEKFQSLMESSVGVEYATLKRYLEKKQWCEADQETARIMKEVIQKVNNSTEINQCAINIFPCVDLSTIDSLWEKHSDGQFSFSVQKEIYQQSSQNRDEFGNRTGWRIKDSDGNYSWRSNSSFDYNSATTPRGHLPSSLWAGEDVIWVENRRDRLIALFARMDSCSIEKA